MMPRTSRRYAVIVSISAMLVACGAGVVGTGTGSAAVPVADAALCSADFGASLACVTAGGSGAPPSAGTATVFWSDANVQGSGTTVLAEVTGDQIVLQGSCTGLRFEGRWSLLSDDRHAFAGTYVSMSTVEPQVGLLHVTPDAADPLRVQVQLFDSAGDSQGGPWDLARTGSRPTLSACKRLRHRDLEIAIPAPSSAGQMPG